MSTKPSQVFPCNSEITKMIEAISLGQHVPDLNFDRIYPTSIRQWTRPHWTPFDVAKRAVELLVKDASTRILDVGSGAGKFCLVGALTSNAIFCGVEQRKHLVESAAAIATMYKIPRVSFLHSSIALVDWSAFNAFYFFNPFYENISPCNRIDNSVEFSVHRFDRCIRIAQHKLKMAAPGTRVVTYHGMGGEMPKGYSLVHCEYKGTGPLELWTKQY